MSAMTRAMRRALRGISPALTINVEEVLSYRAEVLELRRTVEELKREIDELRRDSLRVAELGDVVVEQLAEVRAEARERSAERR